MEKQVQKPNQKFHDTWFCEEEQHDKLSQKS